MSEPIILVPLDGSKQALAALPVAKVLGEIERAALHILHVGEHELAADELRGRLGREASVLDGFTIDPRWNAGSGNSAGRGGDQAASDRHVQAQWRRAGKDAGPHGDESAARCFLSCGAGSAGARCNTMASSACLGAARWDTLHQCRTATCGRACRTQSRRTAGGPRNGHQTAPAEAGSLTTPRYVDQPQHEWPAWSSEFLNRLACICPLGHLHVRIILAHGDTAAEILRLSEKQSTDLIVLAWRGIWEASSRGDHEGHSARGALSHNGGAHLKS